jgi:hypothetical protein
MKSFAYSSPEMQRKLEEAKAYLRSRGKYVLDHGNKWTFTHKVQWDEYRKLAQTPSQQAA